jgi:hypothetical protein
VIVLAAVLSVAATAQTIVGLTEPSPKPTGQPPTTAKAAEWPQEPDSFVGLKFGASEADYKRHDAFKGFSKLNNQKPCMNPTRPIAQK